MPSWQPNWRDVVWDWGAADDARNALRRAADLLDSTANERQYRSRAATAEWRGRHRERFDAELSRLLRQAHDLAGSFRDAANRIVNASQRARDEQRHRERERERWRREKEAEERARRSSGGGGGGSAG